jgi:hypothetical protein
MTGASKSVAREPTEVPLAQFAGYFLWLGTVGVSVAILFRWKVPEPLLIACAAVAGLLLRRA